METIEATQTLQKKSLVCAHCGLPAYPHISEGENYFCCHGCKTAFSFLNDMETSCQLPDPALQIPNMDFSFLDKPEILAKWTVGKQGNSVRIRLQISNIHCASCVSVLERLYLKKHGIVGSQVNFLKKELELSFQPEVLKFSNLVGYLTSLGYQPTLADPSSGSKKTISESKEWTIRLGVAGFCASNIMLLSFPEYLGLDDAQYRHFFGWINLVLALPAVFFSGWVYIKSVINALKNQVLNIDVPIGVGMIATLFLSLYEIISQTGSGYFDSLTGLIFFLLIGRWVQSRTFEFLSFERDFRSYFPLSITRIHGEKEEQILSTDIKPGDVLKIKHGEIIPCDGLLTKGNAWIDYSFVTGESNPVKVLPGEKLLAGGKQTSGILEMKSEQEMSRSQLTTLWNNPIFQKEGKPALRSFSDTVAYYFTPTILVFALIVAGFWAISDPSKSLFAFLSILIIACPCTLSLAYPIAVGNTMRLWGKKGFFLKNAEVVERLSQTQNLVFDKTGTLTHHLGVKVNYVGNQLSSLEKQAVLSVLSGSSHPLSQTIVQFMQAKNQSEVAGFFEEKGKGVSGTFQGIQVKAGSALWLQAVEVASSGSVVFIALNETIQGYFEILAAPHPFVEGLISKLSKTFKISLLSGDKMNGQEYWKNLFAKIKGETIFAQSPENKLTYIKNLQNSGQKICMVGDGLNDAGALRQADSGIAIANSAHQFTPGSDAILLSEKLSELPLFLSQAKSTLNLVRFCFFISVIYNIVGLSYAVQGNLQPIVAAILMPVSSLTVVLVAWLGTGWIGRK